MVYKTEKSVEYTKGIFSKLNKVCRFEILVIDGFKYQISSKGTSRVCARSLTLAAMCFLYMFVWGFSSHSRIFHSYGDITLPVKGYKNFTYTWPVSNEGSFEYHTYCGKGHSFIMVISGEM